MNDNSQFIACIYWNWLKYRREWNKFISRRCYRGIFLLQLWWIHLCCRWNDLMVNLPQELNLWFSLLLQELKNYEAESPSQILYDTFLISSASSCDIEEIRLIPLSHGIGGNSDKIHVIVSYSETLDVEEKKEIVVWMCLPFRDASLRDITIWFIFLTAIIIRHGNKFYLLNRTHHHK